MVVRSAQRPDCEDISHTGRTGVRHVPILIDLHGVLGDVVTTLLSGAYGAPAVGQVPLGVPLGDAIARKHPRVVITSIGADTDPAVAPEALVRLLDRHPQLRILVVEGDGLTGSMWELLPHRRPLGELDPRTLVRVVGEGRS
jgi:hypothetical protein